MACALNHGPSTSSEVWIPELSGNRLPRCSSSRAAASIVPPKGTFGHAPCLAMKHRNVSCGVKLDTDLTLDSRGVLYNEAMAIVAEAIARARAAKVAAVTLPQARADEISSVVTLARAPGQFAKDFTMFTHANSWHGKLPCETFTLLLEREMLSELDHHQLFNVLLEERVTMYDERQGMQNMASPLSPDFRHSIRGRRFREDVVSLTPSKGKISIAAKSLRRDERVAKRMRASAKATKAAAMIAAAASTLAAPPSIQRKVKKMSESVKPFLTKNGWMGQKLLTANEEVELSHKVQDLQGLEAIRSSLQKQLGREPALTEWAEAADMGVGPLSARLHEGRQSKERMVQSNFGLVVSVAKKYQGKGLSFEDLVQAGNIGLLRGCKKFDPGKGFKFSTYAYYWIKQGITRMMAEQARTVRVPVHVSDARARIQKAKQVLFHDYRCLPDEKDVAKVLGITVERLRRISGSFKTCRSLDKQVGKDKNLNLGAIIADKTIEHPESIIDKQFFKQDMNQLLETLNERELDVVRQRFGLRGGKGSTLQVVGSKYKLTRERVRQIETDAVQKLQESDKSNVLKEYIRDYG